MTMHWLFLVINSFYKATLCLNYNRMHRSGLLFYHSFLSLSMMNHMQYWRVFYFGRCITLNREWGNKATIREEDKRLTKSPNALHCYCTPDIWKVWYILFRAVIIVLNKSVSVTASEKFLSIGKFCTLDSIFFCPLFHSVIPHWPPFVTLHHFTSFLEFYLLNICRC